MPRKKALKSGEFRLTTGEVVRGYDIRGAAKVIGCDAHYVRQLRMKDRLVEAGMTKVSGKIDKVVLTAESVEAYARRYRQEDDGRTVVRGRIPDEALAKLQELFPTIEWTNVTEAQKRYRAKSA